MDNNTLQALTALADKLGTTAESLWAVLLAQAPINAAIDTVQAILCVVFTACWLILVRRKTTEREAEEGRHNYRSAEWADEAAFFAWGAGVFMGFVSVLATGSAVRTVVTAFMNPSYWALSQILKTIN